MGSEGKARRREAAARLAEALDRMYQRRPQRADALITAVTRDAAGRAIAATAIIDGIANQPVQLGHGAQISVGDTWRVVNQGGTTTAFWETERRLRAAAATPPVDTEITLPTPTGLQLTTWATVPEPGGGQRAWIFARWLSIGQRYGAVLYDLECKLDGSQDTIALAVRDTRPATSLALGITSGQTVIPRAAGADFPKAGRIKIENERIDYAAATSGAGESGASGTGSSGSFLVAGKNWAINVWLSYCLVDSTGAVFLILGNTANTLTVAGTPASGSWAIYPAFSGCTRGAGTTSAASHSSGAGVVSVSAGATLANLAPDTAYNVRVRARTDAGAVSAWTAWATITTAIDTTAPTKPTGFTVANAAGGVRCTWTGPTALTVPDLAGFYLYKATNAAGAGATLVKTLGPALSTFYDGLEYGETGYFNLKAFDAVGNLSAYAVTTWAAGTCMPAQGVQLLPNSDFERDFDGNALPDGYNYLFSAGGAGSSVTWGNYGRNAGKGIRVVIQYTNPDTVAWFFWPYPIWDRLLPAEVGQYFAASIHVKTNQSISIVRHNILEAQENDGFLYIAVMPLYHSGSVYDPITAPASLAGDTVIIQQLTDGWYRISATHLTTAADVAGGKEYLGFMVGIRNGTGSSIWFDMDQAMLEMSMTPSEWRLSTQPYSDGSSLRGLLIDAGGIKTQDGTLKIGPDGKLYSDLVMPAGSVKAAGGLAVGNQAATPANGEIELWTGGAQMISLNSNGDGAGVFAGGVRLDGLVVGSTTAVPQPGKIMIKDAAGVWHYMEPDGNSQSGVVIRPNQNASEIFQVQSYGRNVRFAVFHDSHTLVGDDLRVGGGAYIGNTYSIPAAGDLWAENDIKAKGGFFAGGVGTNPGVGEILATVAVSGWLPFTVWEVLPVNITSTKTVFMATIPRAITLRSFAIAAFVAGTNNASNFWAIQLITEADGPIATLNTASMSPDTWVLLSGSSFSQTALDTSDKMVWIQVSKTLAPGALSLAGPAVFVT